MKLWGCKYEEVSNGKEALEKLITSLENQNKFDIVIIDMQMPHMNGKKLGEKIKSNPELSDLRLIMMSSIGKRGDAKKMEEI